MGDLRPGISTPLGFLDLRLTCGGLSTDSVAGVASPVSPHATHWVWSDVGGLQVQLVLTTYRWPARDPDQAVPVPAWWGPPLAVDGAAGAVWTWTALRESADVVIAATLPLDGVPANGEDLQALDFETPGWIVAVGGPDDEYLRMSVEVGQLPASWREPLRLRSQGLFGPSVSNYGAVEGKNRDPGTLAWALPRLVAGERAMHHVAVAWRANDDKEQVAAPWYAVDTTAQALLEASREAG